MSASPDGARPPRVTYLITTYNRAACLARAIDSALKQTFQDFEILVVDDGSQDETPQVMARMSDPRIRYLRQPHRGISLTRNAGIEAARGEWIAMLDDDDRWLPEKTERQLAHIEGLNDPKTAVIACPVIVEKADGRFVAPQEPIAEGDLYDAMLRDEHRARTPSAYMFRRDALLAIGGFDRHLVSADDYDILIRLARSYRFAAVQEPLIIKDDTAPGRIMNDPVARLGGSLQLLKRWEPAMKQAVGSRVQKRRRRRRLRAIGKAHRRYLDGIVEAGARREALRYTRRMVPYTRWGWRYMRDALAFALAGRWLYARLQPEEA